MEVENIFDVLEFFSGMGEYTLAQRRHGRECCEIDLKHSPVFNLDSPAGFGHGPQLTCSSDAVIGAELNALVNVHA